MTSEKAALSFNILRWNTLVLCLAFPFTLSNGLLPPRAVLLAGATGVILLSLFIATWRTRNHIWFSLGFLVPLMMASAAKVRAPSAPNAHFFQWVILSFFVAGLPLLLFPRFFRRIARVEQALKSTPQPLA